MAHIMKANDDRAATASILERLVHLPKSGDKSADNTQIFALYVLGEVGRVYPDAYQFVKFKFVLFTI